MRYVNAFWSCRQEEIMVDKKLQVLQVLSDKMVDKQ
jgi:hypothetical protein